MFDIGFLELLLVSIMALLVLGPERLPGAIRTTSLWLGRLKRGFNQIKLDVEREINVDEIKQQLHNESVLKEIEQAKQELENGISNIDHSEIEQMESGTRNINNDTQK